jgi:hypothetical protein
MTLHEERLDNTMTRSTEVGEAEMARQRQRLIDDLAFLVVREHRRRCGTRAATNETPGEAGNESGPCD